MRFRKLLLLFCLLFLLAFAKLYTSSAQVYNENFQIKGLTYKVSLIETAYEIYNISLDNSISTEDLYKNSSKEGYRHYIWLKNTYNSMDPKMKIKLKNIFEYNSYLDYINEVIELNDNSSTEKIVSKIINSNKLNLDKNLKNDIKLFFIYFSNTYFDSYFNKKNSTYLRKSIKLNNIISDKNININKFVEDVSGLQLDKDYKLVFYYSLNPIQSQVFKKNDTIIPIVQLDTSIEDFVSIALYQYSHCVFDVFKDDKSFLDIYDKLLLDNDFLKQYNTIGKKYYSFNVWCEENLIAGFSKYLDYRFFQINNNYSSYAYDLDFYNYLRQVNFNPKSKNLKNTCLDFYINKLSLEFNK